MGNRPMDVEMFACEGRPIRRRRFAFLGAGDPPAPRFFGIGRIGNIRDQVCALLDARQVSADMGVFAVAEPHAVHALARQFQVTDLARLGRILDANKL